MEKNSEVLESQRKYTEYVLKHKANVIEAGRVYGKILCEVLGVDYTSLTSILEAHDNSKLESYMEFESYRQYFYPTSFEIPNKELFNKGWLYHQNTNKHHSEFWIMRDDVNEVIDMPNLYIVEMLIDWLAMSMTQGGNIIEYWNEKGKNKEFSEKTIESIKKCLDVVYK